MKIFNLDSFIKLLSLFVFSSANAGEKIERILSSDETIKVKVCNDRGSIIFKTWSKTQVSIKGELDDLADKFLFEKIEDTILIDVVLTSAHAHGKNNGKGSKLEIWLPEAHDVSFKGIATDLTFTGMKGNIKIDSVSGFIKINDLDGDLSVKNIAGKVNLNNITGNVDLYSVSGAITAKINSNKVKIKSVSSNILVESTLIDNMTLFSVSGITKLSGELSESANVEMGNVSGESFYFAREPFAANINFETGPDGVIKNQLIPFERQDSHINRQEQVVNDDDVQSQIAMNTVNGQIGLKKYKALNKKER